MKKILKILTASVLVTAMFVATVMCCCVLPAVMAHLHKPVMCSHCASEGSSHGKSSNPAGTCLNQLTSVDNLLHQNISFAAQGALTHVNIFDKHLIASFEPSSIIAYPRGSPPLMVSAIPLYLRTFSLRI